MPSQERSHGNDEAGSKQRSPKPATENPDRLAHRQTHPTTIIQRAKSDPGSLLSRDVLQLQRTIGNQAVGRLLRETAGITPTKPVVTLQREGRRVIQRDFDADVAAITQQRDDAPAGSVHRRILTEALDSAARVRAWNSVAAGGSAQRRFTEEGDVAGYIVNYQSQVADATLRIANLVHELTHVSVQQAYDSDFVNYANPPTGEVSGPEYGEPADEEGFDEQVKGIKNEEKRQTDRVNAQANAILDGNLEALKGLVKGSGLTKAQKTEVNAKIDYGRINVHKEYDTVVNQIYLWCKGWNANATTRFFKMLEAMVDDAYNRRQNTALVAAQVAVPAKDKCYITTACVTTRGLPDDCEELTVLRAFRDNYLLKKANGTQLADLYYRHAPQIVEAIAEREDASSVYDHLYGVIRSCVEAIKRGDNEFAYTTYCDMVIRLKEEYASDIAVPSHLP